MDISNLKHKQSFFDAISVTSFEKIHSAMIAWIFSDNCRAISNLNKSKILNKVFGIQSDVIYAELNSKTEIYGIDIVIFTENTTFIIENKLKSRQQYNQLDNYEKVVKREEWVNPIYGFLTFLGERSKSLKWKDIVYDDLLDLFKKVLIDKHISDGVILNEYLLSISQLIDNKKDFLVNHLREEYELVFINGKLIKAKKSKLRDYISINQLETLFQKLFLNSIAIDILNASECKAFDNYEVKESHGQAYLCYTIDCYGEKRNNDIKKKLVNFTFEFQNGTYKIACSLDNYEKSSSSNPTIKYWVSIFEGILSFSRYRQVQKPQNKGKGRVSITKQWKPDYYTLSKHQIIENIAGELLEANKIVSKLIELKAQKDKQE